MKALVDIINEELKFDKHENDKPQKFNDKAVELHVMLDVWNLLDKHPKMQWYMKDENTICVKESDWNKLYKEAKNPKYYDVLLKTSPGPMKTHGYI